MVRRSTIAFWAALWAGLATISVVCPGTTRAADTLVISIAKLRYDRSTLRDTGALNLRFLVDDNSTAGGFEAGLLAGTTSVSIDDGGVFAGTFPLTNCKKKGSGRISCKSADRTIKAKVQPKPVGPFIYIMRVTVRRLGTDTTGSVQPSGPVSVIFHQPTIDRPDTITSCTQKGDARLVCREL
jgi:hypothetical protein